MAAFPPQLPQGGDPPDSPLSSLAQKGSAGPASGGSLLQTLLALLAGMGLGEAAKLFKTFTGGKGKGPNGSKGAQGQPNDKVQAPAGAPPQQLPPGVNPLQLQQLLQMLAQRSGGGPGMPQGGGGMPPM